MDAFYITLPSNSSLTDYPNNTMAQFRTKLPSEIRLTGNWEVGLSDILFPKTFATDSQVFVVYNTDDFRQEYTTAKRYFSTSRDFVEHLNELLAKEYDTQKVYFRIHDDFVTVNIKGGYGIIMDPKLLRLLGFKEDATPAEFYAKASIKENPKTPDGLNLTGVRKSNLHGIYTIYIYTDIIEPNVVGDSLVRLLEIIPIANDKELMCAYRIERPRYVPVQSKSITFPKIELMTDQGSPIPFMNGRVVVKLHFKKKIV